MIRKIFSALVPVVVALGMLIVLAKGAYIPGLGVLTVIAIGIPLCALLAFIIWRLPKTVEGKSQFFDRQFWLAGTLVALTGLLFIAAETYMSFNAASQAVAAASEQVQREYPDLHWAFAELRECDQGKGRYAGIIGRAACDDAVMTQAEQRGVNGRFSDAIARREKLIAAQHE